MCPAPDPDQIIASVYIHFPRCSLPDQDATFCLSYNDACNSEFVKTLLENEELATEYHYVIPHSLYRNIRYVDLCKFIEYWKGTDYSRIMDSSRHDMLKIARLCQSLLLDETIPTVKELNKAYPALI